MLRLSLICLFANKKIFAIECMLDRHDRAASGGVQCTVVSVYAIRFRLCEFACVFFNFGPREVNERIFNHW